MCRKELNSAISADHRILGMNQDPQEGWVSYDIIMYVIISSVIARRLTCGDQDRDDKRSVEKSRLSRENSEQRRGTEQRQRIDSSTEEQEQGEAEKEDKKRQRKIERTSANQRKEKHSDRGKERQAG